MDTNTTRRQLLRVGTSAAAYAAGAAIVAGGVAVATQAKGEAAAISPGLAKLLASYDLHDARLDRFYETVWNPVCDAHRAELETIHKRPPLVVEYPSYRHRFDGVLAAESFSTDNKHDVIRCKGIVSVARDKQPPEPQWQQLYQAARRIVARVKADERDEARLERKYKFAALRAREAELSQPSCEDAMAIRRFPCASIADLRAKLTHLERIGLRDADGGEALDLVIAGLDSIEGRA